MAVLTRVEPAELWMTRSWATVPVFWTLIVAPELAVIAAGVILNSLRVTEVPLLLPLLPLLPPLLPPLLLVPPLPPPLLPPHAAASSTAPTKTIVKPLTTLPAAFWTLLMKRLLLLANAN
jgi:hypothetical protein